MFFENFIRELKRMPQLSDLTPDDQGCYALKINQQHLICFSESFDSESLFLYAAVCPIPLSEEKRLKLYDQLFSDHLFGKETGHCTFALDHASHQLLLTDRLPLLLLTTQYFIEEVQSFIHCLLYWKKEVDNLLEVDNQKLIKNVDRNMLKV
ncbi:MAG: type III secretion system chaperone [Parachlamydiaceae bacterium]